MSTKRNDQSKPPKPTLNEEEIDELFKVLFVEPVVIYHKSMKEVSGKFRIPRRYKDRWFDSGHPDEDDTYIIVEDEEFYCEREDPDEFYVEEKEDPDQFYVEEEDPDHVPSAKSLKAVLPESAETEEADKGSKRKTIEPEHESLKVVLPESAETEEAVKGSKRKIIEPEHVHETPKRQNVLVPPFVPEEDV